MAYKRVDGKKVAWGILGAVALYYLGGLVSGGFGEGEEGFTPDPSPGDADTSAVQAGMQTPMPEPVATPEVPAAAPAPAPAAAAPTPAPVQATTPVQPSQGLDPTKPANDAGMGGSYGKWFSGLSKEAQGIIAGGITGGAGAALNGMAQKNALEDRKEVEERKRQDQIRRGNVPLIAGAIKPRAVI